MGERSEANFRAAIVVYRDNLLSIGDQLDKVADTILAAREGAVAPEEIAPLVDGAKLYRLIAGDLTVLLDGGELRNFSVTGTIQE